MNEAQNNLYNDLKTEQNFFDQVAILSFLTNNLGASYELIHDSEGAIHNWEEMNILLESMIEIDAERSFEFGLQLISLNKNNDTDLEWKHRYLRGNGLTILGSEKILLQLENHLRTVGNNSLSETLAKFIFTEEILDWDKQKAFSTPEFYSMVAGLKVCVYLSDEFELQKKALERIQNERVQEQISWYLEIPDTKSLAESLLKLIHH